MIKTLRTIANRLEQFDCTFSRKWNDFLDQKKRNINFCKNCLCDK